jgi:ribosome biogenesis SPOUT family RNA methylase Rps3
MAVYIIEHLEEKVWKWCIIEYKHISSIVGKKNLWFTNVKKGSKELEKYGRVFKESVSELKLKNCCVLDPEAERVLNPKEARGFDYFIFGGILGDNPPKKRTKKELTSKIKDAVSFNIGKEQMSTDNAVKVVKEIYNGTPFDKMKFKDGIEIETAEGESVIFPFRYLVVDEKPFLSSELVEYLKKKKGF